MVQTVTHFVFHWKVCTPVTVKDDLCVWKRIENRPPTVPHACLAIMTFVTVMHVCWDET